MSDELGDAVNEDLIVDRKEEEGLNRLQELADLKDVLATPQGERWFKAFFKKTELLHDGFNKSAPIMSLKAGQRSVGLRILADVEGVCAEHFDDAKLCRIFFHRSR